MKKKFWWLNVFFVLCSFPLWAVQVTFQVDMSGQVINLNGVHLAGSFADVNGDGIIDNELPNWDPSGIALSDGGNGVWSVTIELVEGLYEYKFVNGVDWSNPEFFSADLICNQILNGNRSVTIGSENLIIPVVCWNECSACGASCIDPFNPPSVPICMVTVDMETGKNHVIWEPVSSNIVQRIVVFKETNALNEFQEIGQVDFNASGAFEDINSNPQVQANRYKIGLMDSCNYVFEPSDGIHKTIHLTTSPGLNNAVNLNWTAYEGLDFPSYKIHRGTGTANMIEIATVASNILSYTDLNPVAGEWNYMIEIEGVSCNPNRSVVYSRSNVMDALFQNVFNEAPVEFTLSPNPAETALQIQWGTSGDTGPFVIYDIVGKKALQGILASTAEVIQVGSLSAGIYLFEFNQKRVRFEVVR
jgi:hypothetical protein